MIKKYQKFKFSTVILFIFFVFIFSGCVSVKFKDKEIQKEENVEVAENDINDEKEEIEKEVQEKTEELNNDSEDSSRDDQSTETEEIDKKEEIKQNKAYKVGEEATLSNVKLIINKTENYIEPEWYWKASEGYKYFLIDVTVENIGSAELDYHYWDFNLQDLNSHPYDYALTVSEDNLLKSGKLSANGKISGSIIFEVPKDYTNFNIIYHSWMSIREDDYILIGI